MKQAVASGWKWRVLSSALTPWPSVPVIHTNRAPRGLQRGLPYLAVTVMVALLTVIFWRIGYAFTLVNVALLYLLPVLVSAVRWGLGPSCYSAVISVVAFDFFITPPVHFFTAADIRYVVSFAVYLAVAVFTAGLAAQLRQRAEEAIAREAVTSSLFTLSKQVAAVRDPRGVLGEIVSHAWHTFGLPSAILVAGSGKDLKVEASAGFSTGPAPGTSSGTLPDLEPRILQWVYTHGQPAGYGTTAHRDSAHLYVPLRTEARVHGVMCFGPQSVSRASDRSTRLRVAQALAGLASISIAKAHFEEEAKIAHLTAESERLRTALLDSISHELRTPLATIIGAVTALEEGEQLLSAEDRHELLQTVHEGSMRMNRLVTNLLGMVRLESGMLRLNRKWCDLSDIIGVALAQVRDTLQNRRVEVNLQPGLPPVAVDEVLLGQALVNLLSNAIKYSPDGTTITVDAMEYDGLLTLHVRDEGIGIVAGDEEKVFEKFYRSHTARTYSGSGLGLAICKGVIEAHGGEVFARRADERGTIVTLRLPVGGDADTTLD